MNDEDQPPVAGALQKAQSVPKLNVEEVVEENGGHSDHRYLTPQLTKSKPFLPPKPRVNSFHKLSSGGASMQQLPSAEFIVKGTLQRAQSVPKLHVEEVAEENGGHLSHRYLTPQPTKRKPFLPPKPRVNSFRQNGIPEDIAVPKRVIKPIKGSCLKTERTHENERLEEAKRDLVATSGFLIPKRKAPQPPSSSRRKSDTNAQDLQQLRKKANWKSSTLGPRVFMSSEDPDLSASPDDVRTKHRIFYTPQPKRKQYKVERHKSLNFLDLTQGNIPMSPVERLAKMKKRGRGSSDSSDSIPSPSPRSPSSLSPHSSTPGTPSTTPPKFLPISPLASPLKVINAQKSPFTGMTWQSTTITDENRQRSVDASTTKSEPPTPGSSKDVSRPSSGYISTPPPTSSPRHRPRLLRHMSSVSSMKSIFGSREVLNDLFLSDRGTNKRSKAIAGIITGLFLGAILFVGLYYGLKYGTIAALVITAVSTLIMSLTLAFTVRGRCVALLMVPTLCTQRGRAAFLAIVVALLLNGPINNIFLNANEVSNSMSCSAELAYNQSQQIQDVAAEVFDLYVRNLENSVQRLQDLADGVEGVFKPLEYSLHAVHSVLDRIKDDAKKVLDQCQALGDECKEAEIELNKLYVKCVETNPLNFLDGACDILSLTTTVTSEFCEGTSSLCTVPESLYNKVDEAVDGISDITDQFTTNINFMPYWEYRNNQTALSSTFTDIQEAVKDDIDYTLEIVNYIFSIFDKLLALSVTYLLLRSYQYHTAYRTEDKFDNFYITKQFKQLDEARKKTGKNSLLPLKKSERVHLIDVTSFRLSKPEKGLFRLGLVTLAAHICIATILILVDNGLYYLLQLIKKHGSVKVDFSIISDVQFEIEGDSLMSDFIRNVFGYGAGYENKINVSFDNTECLPTGHPPNHFLAIGIGFCYLLVIFMILFQAYALRLRRRVAEYFYPERELERLYFLYNDTLKKRQTLFKFLRDIIKQKKKENDAAEKISIRVYLADHYPTLKKLFVILRIRTKPMLCFGCNNDDDGTFKQCEGDECDCRYCDDCLNVTNNTCSICGYRFEDLHATTVNVETRM